MSEDMARMADFASLARGMGAARNEESRLQLAVEAAVDLISRCKHAGITVNRDGELVTLAATDDTVRTANEWQNDMGEGPCHDPSRHDDVVVSSDLTRDERWPKWGERVMRELGAASMLSVMVYSQQHSYGTLSLYSAEASAFTGDDLAVAEALAGHLAMSVAAGREIEGLGVALHSRTVIGQAEGILMERLGLDADQALAFLRRVSSTQNTKLIQIALDLVRTRELPS